MNWEAVAAIGEVVGALAVVVTLVYLTAQLRQNTTAVSTSTHESITAGFNAVNQVVMGDEQLSGIFLRGTAEPSSLLPEEAIRYSFLMRSWANQWLKLHRLHKAKAIKDTEWEMYANEAAEAFRTPGGRLFREQNPVFSELWEEIDRFGGFDVSSVRLGVPGADPRDRASGNAE